MKKLSIVLASCVLGVASGVAVAAQDGDLQYKTDNHNNAKCSVYSDGKWSKAGLDSQKCVDAASDQAATNKVTIVDDEGNKKVYVKSSSDES